MKNFLKIPTKITKELAEETGLHLGDGSMNYYKNKNRKKGLFSLRGHILDDRRHYDTRIKWLYKKLYNLDISLRESKTTGIYGFQKWSDEIVNFKQLKLSLPLGKKGIHTAIPKIFLKEDSLKISIIRGLFDTDGCVYIENKKRRKYPRLKISSTSEVLSKQVLEIIKDLNLHATRYKTKRKEVNWNDLYNVEIRGWKQTLKFFLKIDPKNPKHIDKFYGDLNSTKRFINNR